MFEMSFWGFFVRFTQSLAQASPFILTGFLIAAVFRRFYGPRRTFEIFGSNRTSGLLRAWAIGMLLPVCSLGAIPVVRELRRSGLSGGTILAFAISAPLFNPLSLLYGLTLSEPFAILSFAGCSLVIVTVLGIVWDKLFPDSSLPVPEEEPLSQGLGRVVAVGSAGARDITGPSTLYIICGLIGVGLLGAILPANSLQLSFNNDDPIAPVRMLGLSIPVYATPMLAMSQMGGMFQHANSIGAAFVLMTLGAGLNIGLCIWMWFSYGTKKSVVWLLLLSGIAVGLGYAVDRPLLPKDVEPAGHTHAFDVYCQPFIGGGTPPTVGYQAAAIAIVKDIVKLFEWYSLKILAGALALGLLFRLIDVKGHVQRWIESKQGQELRGDIVLPSHVIGGVVLVGLIAASVVGCYAYYPPPSDVLEEMRLAKGEALSGALTGDTKHAVYWIKVYDEWSRKLEVGTFLRHGSVSEFHHWKARLIREQLELMEHSIEDNEIDETRRWVAKLGRSHSRLKQAYSNEL